MTSDNYNRLLKKYVKGEYKKAKADLSSCFIDRGMQFARPTGLVGEVTRA